MSSRYLLGCDSVAVCPANLRPDELIPAPPSPTTHIEIWIFPPQLSEPSSWETNSCLALQQISRPFTEPESSLSCSQEPVTGPYPKLDEASSHPPTLLFKMHSNIILSSVSRSSKWSLHFFRLKLCMLFSLASRVLYVSPILSSWIWWPWYDVVFQVAPSLRVPDWNCVCVSHLPHACYMSRLSSFI
jgi:hypothetical protein